MSKCIQIFEGFHLNLKQIVTFDVIANEQIIINTNAHFESASSQICITLTEDPKELGSASEGIIYVELQELHRIKREISTYFGIKEPKMKQ